jgi:hypothetical protein
MELPCQRVCAPQARAFTLAFAPARAASSHFRDATFAEMETLRARACPDGRAKNLTPAMPLVTRGVPLNTSPRDTCVRGAIITLVCYRHAAHFAGSPSSAASHWSG